MSDPIRPITSVGTSLKRGVQQQLEKVRPKADEIQPEETFSEKLERNLNSLGSNLNKPTLVEKKPPLSVSKPPYIDTKPLFTDDKKDLLFPEKKLDLIKAQTAEEKWASYQASNLRSSIFITQKQLDGVKTKLDYLTKGAAGYEEKQAELLQRQMELELQLKKEQQELDRLSKLAGSNFNLLA